jgi:hypothetical protein
METKIYAIIGKNSSLQFNSNEVIGFSFSKIDAEYKAWQLEEKENENIDRKNIFHFSFYTWYSVVEIPYCKIEKDKNYNEFANNKKKEIEEKIKKYDECKTKDSVEIEKLKEEIKLY